MRYLSPEWLDAMHDAAARSEILRRRSAGVHLAVQQTVTRGGDGDLTYHLYLDDGEVGVRPGPADHPTIVLRTDRLTATAIALAERSVQAALVSGDLEVSGDLVALVEHHAIFSELDDVFTEVRHLTEW